jgi:hypothetical protein
MTTAIAYVFLNSSFDWECIVTERPSDFEGYGDWFLAGAVNNLKELFQLMDKYDFDAEYFYEYVDHCMSHRLFNLLNKDGAYY